MELFKYCKREHMESLKLKGAVRIGTLYDYRKTDKYGELTSDSDEGTKKLEGSTSNLNAETIKNLPALRSLICIEGDGRVGEFVLKNGMENSPDYLIFSASSTYSKTEHQRWFEEEGYDACYKINSANLFFWTITATLGVGYQCLGYAPVVYADSFDISDPLADIHPAMVKRHATHGSQFEVRALWQPVEMRELEPIIISGSEAWRYCKEHCILNGKEDAE